MEDFIFYFNNLKRWVSAQTQALKLVLQVVSTGQIRRGTNVYRMTYWCLRYILPPLSLFLHLAENLFTDSTDILLVRQRSGFGLP